MDPDVTTHLAAFGYPGNREMGASRGTLALTLGD
jgi:hypothetical protein